MLWTISFIIIFIFSGCLFFLSTSISATHPFSKCIPMLYGMTSSVAIGVLFGTKMPEQLGLSTIFSILLSFLLIIIVLYKFQYSGMIEGLSSSFMGAMMGAMLGVMLSEAEIVYTIVAMDFIFLSSMLLIFYLGRNKEQKKSAITPVLFLSTITLSIAAVLVSSLLVMGQQQDSEEMTTHSHHHDE